MSWREKVCEEARSWYGTPYVPGARVKGVGTDCGGIVYDVYNPICGPFKHFPSEPCDWALHTDEEKYLDFIMPHVREIFMPQPGDLSVFHVRHTRVYAHAAIYLGGNQYIHAWGRPGHGAVTICPLGFLLTASRPFPPKHFTPVNPRG